MAYLIAVSIAPFPVCLTPPITVGAAKRIPHTDPPPPHAEMKFLLLSISNVSIILSVFTQEKDNVLEENAETQAIRIESIEVRREEVLAILIRVKIDKSPGPDGIYPKILWEAREEIAEPLALIFTSSLSTGIVPEDWRIANVVPLVQEGE